MNVVTAPAGTSLQADLRKQYEAVQKFIKIAINVSPPPPPCACVGKCEMITSPLPCVCVVVCVWLFVCVCTCGVLCVYQAKRQSEKQQKRNEFVRTELAQEDMVTGFSPIFDPG